MAKNKTQFVCEQCGGVTPRWAGKCPACGEWNCLVEERVVAKTLSPARGETSRSGFGGFGPRVAPKPIRDVARTATERMRTGLDEFDRILGGGLVPGAVTLIGGEPGIGKSTLLLQALGAMASLGRRALYVTGEEAAEQVRLRAERLNTLPDELYVTAETSLESVLTAIQEVRPSVIVMDSIQSVASEELSSATGSVAQVRDCAARLTHYAKQTHTPVFLVGHVTKSGAVAGPRVLEHMVDTVLYFEGANNAGCRILRAVKNRFGSVNEIAIFEMRETGLATVENPSQVFLEERPHETPGSVVTAVMEGARPVLVEIQALLSFNGGFGAPRRSVSGIDQRRVALLVAVLEQRLGLRMTQQDVFVNVPGGLRIEETAADLAVLIAMVSSLKNRPVPPDWLYLGEVGLAGEIRSVPRLDRRLGEGAGMGFTHCLLGGRPPKNTESKIQVLSAPDARAALNRLGLMD